ncbi:MAG TPA: methyl-accepting chemotaxis protein [Ktedonobacterales bacterium]
MNSESRPGWSLAAQMNAFMAATIGIAGIAVFGLGLWAYTFAGNPAAAGTSLQTTVLAVTLAVTALAVFLVAGSWLWMRATVRDRVLGLAEICQQVGSGDRSLRALVAGEDEFASLATSLNGLLDGKVALASGDSQDAATLQGQIEKLLQEVSAVGDGDLRVQAEVTPDTLGVLADSFNYMIEELAKVVGRVQATTLQVTNATRRLLDRSAEVASASETQSAQISNTSEAVAALANFVQLSARNALTAAESAQEALRNAKAGQQAVVQTIDGMVHIRENVQETSKRIKRLGERSQEVGEIVRLIEDIAEQTNLLALNAAIQSAMAGEHGRGFSVVAEEIRLLAERSAEATKKIATIVKSIQGDTYEAVVAMEESTQEVVNGSRLADEAGQSLQSIYSAVDRQAQTIEGIAHAAQDRAQTADAVASAMSRIADITRQTNTATQDAASSVSYLAELAEQLRASVATFRLPDQIAEAAGLPGQQPDATFNGGFNAPDFGIPGWGAHAGAPMAALPAAGYTAAPGYGGMSGMPDHGYGAMMPGMPNPGYGAMSGMPDASYSAMLGMPGMGGMPDPGYGAAPPMPDFGAMPPFPGMPAGPPTGNFAPMGGPGMGAPDFNGFNGYQPAPDFNGYQPAPDYGGYPPAPNSGGYPPAPDFGAMPGTMSGSGMPEMPPLPGMPGRNGMNGMSGSGDLNPMGEPANGAPDFGEYSNYQPAQPATSGYPGQPFGADPPAGGNGNGYSGDPF